MKAAYRKYNHLLPGKTKRPMKNCSQTLFLAMSFVLITMLPTMGWGQLLVLKGDRYPTVVDEGTWFLDTLQHTLSRFESGAWVKSNARIEYTEVFGCGPFLIMMGNFHGDRWSMVVEPGAGADRREARIFGGSKIDCEPFLKNFVIPYGGKHPDRLHEATITMGMQFVCDQSFVPDTLLGIPAFCMSAVGPGLGGCQSYRNWGMLRSNGLWLIEPEFGAPFHFKKHLAHVIYHGQKRLINEKGEFVDGLDTK